MVTSATTLETLVRLSGEVTARSSRRDKIGLIANLLGRLGREETSLAASYLAGEIPQGRVGVGPAQVDALRGLVPVEQAAGLDPGMVLRALMLSGDPARVTRTAFDTGAAGLSAIGLEFFRPILPMLALPAEDLDDALARLATSDLEFKLDGACVQVHKRGEEVRVYSRQGHEVTAAVPEIPELIAPLPVADLVLDGEVLALHADGRPHPFQTSMAHSPRWFRSARSSRGCSRAMRSRPVPFWSAHSPRVTRESWPRTRRRPMRPVRAVGSGSRSSRRRRSIW